jgi:glycosyltransferase involved in cell wall biosynthesis
MDQTIPLEKFEVIIVDNNSEDTTGEIGKTYQNKYRLIRCVTQRRKGVAQARNMGAACANADIILFLDDDMIASKNLLEEHIKAHSYHKGTVLGYFDSDWEKKGDTFLEYLEESGAQNSFDFKDENDVGYQHFFTGNISVKKHMFNKVGGFDEKFPAPSVEDIELGYRLYCYGDKIKFNKKAYSFHDYQPNFKDFRKKRFRVGLPLAYYLFKFPHLRPQIPLERIFWLLCPIFNLCAVIMWPVIRVNTKKLKWLRYRYYYWTLQMAIFQGLKKYEKRYPKQVVGHLV